MKLESSLKKNVGALKHVNKLLYFKYWNNGIQYFEADEYIKLEKRHSFLDILSHKRVKTLSTLLCDTSKNKSFIVLNYLKNNVKTFISTIKQWKKTLKFSFKNDYRMRQLMHFILNLCTFTY